MLGVPSAWAAGGPQPVLRGHGTDVTPQTPCDFSPWRPSSSQIISGGLTPPLSGAVPPSMLTGRLSASVTPAAAAVGRKQNSRVPKICVFLCKMFPETHFGLTRARSQNSHSATAAVPPLCHSRPTFPSQPLRHVPGPGAASSACARTLPSAHPLRHWHGPGGMSHPCHIGDAPCR